MNNEITFEQYYTSVAERAGIKFSPGPFLDRVKIALENGDEHLNTIRLREWDSMGCNPWTKSSITKSLKDHGDGWSIAGSVCVLKQAAINGVKDDK